MSSTFYVSADQETGARWTFTGGDLAVCLERLWPGTDVSEGDGILEFDVRDDGGTRTFAWQTEHRVLTFPDQEHLEEAARVVHRLLRALAPDVPAVWWADYDATPEPLDLAADEETFTREFGS